jgi:hypothetical protein
MPEQEQPKPEDAEIIEEKVVSAPHLERIKIKIKERIATRKRHRQKISLPLKVIVLVLAAILGFKAGERLVSKYISYWKRPHLQYRGVEDSRRSRGAEIYPIIQ